MTSPLDPVLVSRLVSAALAEDLGERGDITSELAVPAEARARAAIIAKQSGTICGTAFAVEAFRQRGTTDITVLKHDGSKVESGDAVVVIEGSARSVLSAERVALNFVGRLSGVATLTAQFVEAVKGTRAKITDTRKTTPGLRAAEKYAVRCGGGVNHRFGLYDAVLIKDNHVIAAGGVGAAVSRAKASVGHLVKIEAEITALDQLDEAIRAGADVVMLDNFSVQMCADAVNQAQGRVVLEASGGIRLDTVRAYAETGIDVISAGALTHSPKQLDISLEFE